MNKKWCLGVYFGSGAPKYYGNQEMHESPRSASVETFSTADEAKAQAALVNRILRDVGETTIEFFATMVEEAHE